MINCYNSEYKTGNDFLTCASLCSKCDPRPCKGCPRLKTANAHQYQEIVKETFAYCKEYCKNYKDCNTLKSIVQGA